MCTFDLGRWIVYWLWFCFGIWSIKKKKKKTEWLKQIEFDDMIDYVSLDLLFIFEWGKTGYDSVNQKFIKVEILFFVLVHDSLLHFWIIIILQ